MGVKGIPNGSWGFDSYGECLKTYYREQGPVQYCEMAYHGMLSSVQDCLVIRRVSLADPGIWLIVNDIGCRGRHVVEEYYHMDPRVKAIAGDAGHGRRMDPLFREHQPEPSGTNRFHGGAVHDIRNI